MSAKQTGNRGEPVRRNRRANQDIVYTPAKHFDKFKFLLHMLTVVAVVLALTLGMAIFFKVEVITVSGMEKYSAWDIREASGIEIGENLITLNKAKVGSRITSQLPYVDAVRIGIKLPDTVNIEITELTVVYTIEDTEGGSWLIDSDGSVVEQITGAEAQAYTKIEGVLITPGTVGQKAVAAELPEETTDAPEDETTDEEEPTEEETVADPVTVYASEQLSMALTIARELEANGVVGGVTVVDVTNLFDLQLWYEDRYQVLLGDSGRLGYKISAMKNAIDQMTDYQQGQLDASFTQWTDRV